MPADTTALIGRQDELRRIEAAFDDARDGTAAALAIRGDAGIGKTALLGEAAAVARAREMAVIAARGVEAEADIPFAGLTSLLAPLLDLLPELPAAQRTTLEGALALGPPVERPRFAVAAATASLIGAAAERQAIAALVDDAQWLDEESLETVLFAARRLRHDRLALIVAARPTPARVAPGLDEIELRPLAGDDADAVLGLALGADASDGVRRELIAAAAGNPLALLELPRGLTPDQLAGAAALPRPLRASTSIETVFGAQLAALPPPARLALAALAALAATERDAGRELLADALTGLGLGTAELELAERAGLVADPGSGLPAFRHPLVRSAAFHAAPPADRRRVQRALAHAHERRGDRARVAWHRAAAATGPDEEVAAQLETVGEQARARGAPSTAAHALERAAELSADPRRRSERQLAAVADLARTARPERAVTLAEQAVGRCDDPLVRADLQRLRGEVMIRLGAFEPAVELLRAEAERVAPVDRERAARMLLSASVRYRASGGYAAMRAAAERAHELAGDAPDVALLADLVLAHVLVVTGRRADGDRLIERRAAALREPPPGATPELLTSPVHASLWAERPDRCERMVEALIADGRARSAPAALAFPLGIRAQLRFRQGRWQQALADGEEAVGLATDTAQLALVAFTGGALAEVEAAGGRDADCRAHADRALAIADPTGSDAIGIYAHAALGLLELGLGRLDAAVEELSWCRAAARRMDMVEASVAHWAGSLVEALARTGARDALADVVTELDEAAAATGGAYAAGCAARGRGLLAGDDFAAPFERSVALLSSAGLPFEVARSQLALGERLRRDRRPRDARVPLLAAHAAFERLGARPWTERAAGELRASGAELPGDRPASAGELTAAELRVALLAADGRTNPEIATELFVSRRTVEHQLSAAYRKLNLRSRSELAGALRR